MIVSDAQLDAATSQAIALAGSQERFQSLLSAKAQTGGKNLPLNKTVDTEYAATLAVIADLKASRTPLEQAQATIVELRSLTQTLGASESNLIRQVAALTEENDTLKSEQATILASVDNRAGMKALAIAGSQGIPALAVDRGGGIKEQGKTAEQHLAAYAALTDPKERAEYYAKFEKFMLPKKPVTT